jgi:hypothetical protein
MHSVNKTSDSMMMWLTLVVFQLQAEAGLDIVMADRVGLISKALKDASV